MSGGDLPLSPLELKRENCISLGGDWKIGGRDVKADEWLLKWFCLLCNHYFHQVSKLNIRIVGRVCRFCDQEKSKQRYI